MQETKLIEELRALIKLSKRDARDLIYLIMELEERISNAEKKLEELERR